MATTDSDTPSRARLHLSVKQLLASALAAVTATIAASYLGVSGTVIGAAVASVLTVTGNAVYGHSIDRTSERVRTVVPIGARWLPGVEPADADDAPTATLPTAALPAAAPGHQPTAGEPTAEQPSVPHPARSEHVPSKRLSHLALASVAVFAAVLAVVTSVELVAGRPLSNLLRGKSGQGTTLLGTSHQARSEPTQPAPATVTQTVTPHIVITTPTVTQTAPPVTATTTPTVTTTPSAPQSGTPTPTQTPTGASTKPPTP